MVLIRFIVGEEVCLAWQSGLTLGLVVHSIDLRQQPGLWLATISKPVQGEGAPSGSCSRRLPAGGQDHRRGSREFGQGSSCPARLSRKPPGPGAARVCPPGTCTRITSCLTTPPPRSPSPVRPPCPTTHHRLAGPSDHPRLQVPRCGDRRARHVCVGAASIHLLIDRCRRWERQRVSKRL